jgi:hypothetical protein
VGMILSQFHPSSVVTAYFPKICLNTWSTAAMVLLCGGLEKHDQNNIMTTFTLLVQFEYNIAASLDASVSKYSCTVSVAKDFFCLLCHNSCLYCGFLMVFFS